MRITQEGMIANSVARLQKRVERFERAQSQLATGKLLSRPSDDPAAANRALVLRASLRAREQEARNAGDAGTLLGMADAQLQASVGRLHRARDLIVRGVNDVDAAERQAIAVEISGIRDELVSIANSRHAGRPVFAGFAAGDAVAKVAGAWTYQGDAGQIVRRVSEQDEVTVNVTAEDVFGFSSGSDVFSLLDTVVAQLGAGDQAGLQASLSEVDGALTRIGDGQATVGAATNRVESALSRNQEALLTIRGELSATEDVEVTAVVMELKTQEVAYQATLAALSRALQPSLVDFLR